ncbi:MAG: hypothetical protein JSS39_14515 [Nitrospira sp.]|nr:hypothetical protein [Nitrospira sp.]
MFEPMSDATLRIMNPPNLMRQVRVRVVKSFCIGGKVLQVGEKVSIAWHDAQSLAALGKCVFLTEDHRT